MPTNDDDNQTRRAPSHIASLRQIREQQRAIDALIQPLVEQAYAEVGNDPDASFALIKRRVGQHAGIQQAILDLEVTRLLREHMIAAGWNPAEDTVDGATDDDRDDGGRQAD